MNLYIDCEWDGYQGELLSMALVGDGDVLQNRFMQCVSTDPDYVGGGG